ncbi:EF-hand domain-containing protein [Tropicimonas marinistellae]|uniref:EF-hand domain-containing protein n=1 Tax=Tropicimonas marinistellae TaxID=1739787 RepID=UPI00082AC08F|nr:EF-hand domain-containing protein [Tropicimonas marinistellae]
MTIKRIVPMAAVAAAMIGSGTLVATAQDTTAPDQAAKARSDTPLVRTDFKGGKRGHGGGHFGGRIGSEMFTTLFNQIDANNDGSVTQEEVDAFRAAKVSEADASGDGGLSIEEFDTLYREFTRSRMVDAFQDLDADGDGVISVEEMDARFGDVVERMDRDDDGALTLQYGRRNK